MTRSAWILAAALALSACAGPTRLPDGGRAPDAATLQQWTASGRMAVKAGEEGGSGAFVWSQAGSTSRLDLRGPLGTGALTLTLDAGRLSVADASGRRLDADAARAEFAARLGADLPWDHLRYWLLGVAAPEGPAGRTEGTTPPLRVIEQAGWRLAYESFSVEQGVELPRRFAAERDAVRVRVIVDAWTLPPAAARGSP